MQRSPDVWISLPYAPPLQLEAFALASRYTPEPWHDLFMLATSLYRLFVAWAPTVEDASEALTLAAFWIKLMTPLDPRKSDSVTSIAAEGSAPDMSHVGALSVGISSPAAMSYDVGKFKDAARIAVLSSVPDWPW